MPSIKTIKFYWDLFKTHQRGLEYSKEYQVKLYNWFPPFYEQDLWLSRFIKSRGLLNDKPNIRAGVFTIAGPEWAIRLQHCDLKLFLARENLEYRPQWKHFMLHEPCIDLSIGFDDIKDNPKYIHIPFWVMWTLSPDETYHSIKEKVEQWNSISNSSYSERKFCAFLCSHGDRGREMIMDELSKIGRVDSAGRWKHNDDSLKTKYADNKLKWLRNYRFNLTPENSNGNGYVTEKILDAISSGCIPIYWGSNNKPDPEIFNQDAIIFFKMNESNPDVIKLVDELNSNEKAYMDFACQRRLNADSADKIWGYFEILENKLREIIANI